MFGPTYPLFSSPQMALTHKQELNTLLVDNEQNNHFIKQINSKISTLNSNIATIKPGIQGVQESIESLLAKMKDMMSRFPDTISSKEHYHHRDAKYFHSKAFHSNPPHRELHLPRVKVKKCDGSNPTVGSHKWNINYPCMTPLMNWPNYIMFSTIYIMNARNGGNGIKNHAKGVFFGHKFCPNFMNTLTQTYTIWVILPS
jgi:hypothetical protein